MPRLSDSMEEGTIIKWLKQPGDEVRVGDPLADIETDKATVTYEADESGFVQIVAAEGATLQIGATIARLLDSADAAKAQAAPAADPVPSPPTAPAEPARGKSAPPGGAVPVSAAPPATGRVKASPVARRIAGELGVALESIAGSGPDGRIVKADVLAASEGVPGAPAYGPAPSAGDAAGAK